MKYQIVLVGMDPTTGEIRGKVVVATRATLPEINELNDKMLKQRTLPEKQWSRETKFAKEVQTLIEKHHGNTAFALERIMVQ